MLHFDLKDLRVFSAVALTGSITKAAEYIHLSPSATSDRLSDLETRAGTRLFRRSSRGLRMTEAGEVFAESAKRILLEAEALETRLAPFAHAQEKRVTVCCNYNAGVTFLPRRLGRFLSHFQDVQVDVVQRSSPEIVRHVAAGEADVGITAFEGMHPLLTFEPFAEDRLVAVLPPGHPLAAKREISFSELFPYNYIAVGPYSPMQEFLYERAREEGKRIRPKLTASSHDAVISLVEEGAGVSVLPSGVVTKQRNVVELKLKEAWSLRRLRLCRLRDRSANAEERNALVDRFVAALLDDSGEEWGNGEEPGLGMK